MKHWKWIASTGLVAVLAIANVGADTPKNVDIKPTNVEDDGPQLIPLFRPFDIDANGEITRAELRQAAAAFETLDRNDDGVLSSEDFPRRTRQGRHGRRPHFAMVKQSLAKAADADKNGEVTEPEWTSLVGTIQTDADGVIDPASLHKVLGIERPHTPEGDRPERTRTPPKRTAEQLIGLFSRLDRDASGVLEADELTRNRPERTRGERHERGRSSDRREQGRRNPMSRADSDGSGSVSAEEWQAMFSKMDANGDGTLTEDELGPRHSGPGLRRQR